MESDQQFSRPYFDQRSERSASSVEHNGDGEHQCQISSIFYLKALYCKKFRPLDDIEEHIN
jgi:hypothetical protein